MMRIFRRRGRGGYGAPNTLAAISSVAEKVPWNVFPIFARQELVRSFGLGRNRIAFDIHQLESRLPLGSEELLDLLPELSLLVILVVLAPMSFVLLFLPLLLGSVRLVVSG